MEIDSKLIELLSKPLLEAFDERFNEFTYRGGRIAKHFGEGKYAPRKSKNFMSYVTQRVLQKFTLKDDEQEYYYLTSVMNWHKGQTMVQLSEIGTILDFSIPRGLFIGAWFQYPYVRALRNLDDQIDTATWTPLEKMFQKELEGKDESSFVELFLKIPDKTTCGYGGKFGMINDFKRSQFTMESMPKRRDISDYMDSDPSIFVIPRNGKTIVTVRFQSFNGRLDNSKTLTKADVFHSDKTGKKFEVALPESFNIQHAYNLLLRTIAKTKPFAVDGDQTSQYTGGLASYLAFEIARSLNKPEEEISFFDFLDYEPRVIEIADTMNANAPGVEVFPLLWYPLCNLNPAGQDEIKYTYSKYDYETHWKAMEKQVKQIRSEGLGLISRMTE